MNRINGTYWHNIIGKQKTPDAVVKAVAQERERTNGKSVVMLGHHPLNNVARKHMSTDVLSKLSSAGISYYICGHLHMIVYVRRPGGILELAAGALRNGDYRILAFDNDVLAFSDCKLDSWPAAVLTFPKPARFMVQAEPFATLYNAGQIRCLAYAPSGVASVEASVDGTKACTLKPANGTAGLYTCQWDYAEARQRSLGSHTIELVVKDNEGHTTTIREKFSFDGRLPRFAGFTVWTVLVRMPEIIFGFWLFLSALFPVLVVGSRAHSYAVMCWAERSSSPSPMREKANKVVGPTAVGWISAVNNGQATVNEFFDGEKLNTLQKVIVIATWGIQTNLVKQTTKKHVL